MNRKVKLLIILLILIVAVPITAAFAATKEGMWNGKDLKTNTTKWNGKTFASSNTTASIFEAMNSAKSKTGEERFAWLNSEPRDQNKAIWGLGADIYKEGVSCIGHRLAGWEGYCSIQVFDMYPNTTEKMSNIDGWEWQTLAKLITETVGKGEDSIEERRVVQWCYDHSKNFNILKQDKRKQNGSYGESYDSKKDEAKKMAVNKFESTSTSDGKQEVVQKGDYTFIGPYNFTIMGGEISEITITTADNKEIKAGPNDGKIFVSIDGKTPIKMNSIKADNKLGYTNYSGNNFYIVYKGKISGANKIKVTRNKEGYRARLVVIEALGINGQNLILFDGAPSNEKTDLYLPEAKPSKGNLKVIKVDKEHNEIKLKDVEFILYNKGTKQYVQADNNYVTTGYTSKKSEAKVFVTDKDGQFEVKDLTEGTYVAYETKNPNYGYVIVEDGFEKKVVADKTEELKAENELARGNLKVIKVDAKNNVVKLAGVGFNIKNEDIHKYVKIKNNEVEYVDDVKDATEFITDKNGEFIVENLLVGTYKAYETKNPNYGYEILKDGIQKEVTVDKTEELKAENEQKYVKLSGYVWKDIQSEKQSIRNDLFKDNDYDDKDELLKDIVVRLKYKGEATQTVATTKTNSNGAYLFKDVEVEKLADYFIEFEYNGITYTNVIPHLDKDNGSKAIEGNARTTFNNKFAEITKDTKIDGTALEYSYEEHKSTLTNGDKFVITSTTSEAGLNIKDKYTPGMTEIKNLNLGLYEREQPDLAVVKDIDNVRITVNGYEHMYKYESRFVNAGEYSDGFNVGVKFGTKYGTQTYSRAIYKSDYDYKNDSDKSKELKAYITYKIALKNESTSLISKVNSLVDYYDSKYTLVAVGTEIGNDGNITGTAITHTDGTYNDDYKKVILNTNIKINPQSQEYIYVQFSMDKETIGSIMFDANGEEIKDKILLDNVVEINSYATYKDGALYAGIDKDSRPGNAIPGDRDTYEDDTDAAPALILELANARKITGTVFLDSTTEEVRVGQERVGDGIYTNGEKTIPGVTVKLVKEDGSIEKTATTDENGYFELSGFIPGNYTIVYTWGDSNYTVDDYKGTIYKDMERFGHRLWYTENVDTRYSDAIDNYETRKLIDSGEHPEITTMDSTTPAMKFGIEMVDQNTGRVLDITPGLDKVEFLIKNVDFGIVERPRQKLDISKNATAVKITLANQSVILDAKIVKDASGNWKAEGAGTNNLTITQPQNSKQKPLLWAIVDNEMVDGAVIQIEYTISVANNSELDYDSERYYKYGIKEGNKVIVKPEGVYDYLDGEMALDTSKETENAGWVTKTTAEYTNSIKTEPTIIDEYISRYSSTTTDPEGFITTISGYESFMETYSEEIREATLSTLSTVRQKMAADKTILYNANLEKELQPGETNTVKLYTSKKLANSDEIDLNNSAEITKVKRNTETGRKVTPRTSTLFDSAEEIVVTPPTGENQDYVLPITLSVSTLIILGAGVVLIKKKVLNK